MHSTEYYPSIQSSPSDYFLTSMAEVRVSLTERMFGSFKTVLDYDSTPAQGSGTTDLKYILGLGWDF